MTRVSDGLIGLEGPFMKLSRWITENVEGNKKIVHIRGDAGSGKSFLLSLCKKAFKSVNFIDYSDFGQHKFEELVELLVCIKGQKSEKTILVFESIDSRENDDLFKFLEKVTQMESMKLKFILTSDLKTNFAPHNFYKEVTQINIGETKSVSNIIEIAENELGPLTTHEKSAMAKICEKERGDIRYLLNSFKFFKETGGIKAIDIKDTKVESINDGMGFLSIYNSMFENVQKKGLGQFFLINFLDDLSAIMSRDITSEALEIYAILRTDILKGGFNDDTIKKKYNGLNFISSRHKVIDKLDVRKELQTEKDCCLKLMIQESIEKENFVKYDKIKEFCIRNDLNHYFADSENGSVTSRNHFRFSKILTVPRKRKIDEGRVNYKFIEGVSCAVRKKLNFNFWLNLG